MRAVNACEDSDDGVAVYRLHETIFVAVAGDVITGAPVWSTTASTASGNAAVTPASSVAASIAAVLLPARLAPVVPAPFLVAIIREFVSSVTVLT